MDSSQWIVRSWLRPHLEPSPLMSTQAEALAFLEANHGCVTVPAEGPMHIAYRVLALRIGIRIVDSPVSGQVEVNLLGIPAHTKQHPGAVACCGDYRNFGPKR
jgi:hypothetical protein